MYFLLSFGDLQTQLGGRALGEEGFRFAENHLHFVYALSHSVDRVELLAAEELGLTLAVVEGQQGVVEWNDIQIKIVDHALEELVQLVLADQQLSHDGSRRIDNQADVGLVDLALP